MALMLWDGLGFFGMDHMKLGRLRGEKVDFCTFFKSPHTLMLSSLTVGIATFVIVTHLKTLGM